MRMDIMKYALTALVRAGCCVSTQAQKPRQRAPQKKVAKQKRQQPTEEEQRLAEKTLLMMSATQKIVVIDSMVVDKNKLLQHYALNPEVGSLSSYADFFGKQDQPNAIVNMNQMGSKCYFPMKGSNGVTRLYTSDKIAGEWSAPALMKGIDTQVFKDINYPFVMSDGTTCYFAAKGEESLGGYDIFVTRFDPDQQQLLTPENIGMPFNSPGNDYLFAIDDIEQLGWFVTDRNQPEGKVCIYCFIPSEVRDTYPAADIPEEKLRQLASLNRIADTWGNGKARKAALQRKKALEQRRAQGNAKQANAAEGFVVNDQRICFKAADFKAEGNPRRFTQLTQQKQQLEKLSRKLASMRIDYSRASGEHKLQLGEQIRKDEQQELLLISSIEQLTKDIRKAENSQ